MWGGQYGGAERGGMEREVETWPIAPITARAATEDDDGGWKAYESKWLVVVVGILIHGVVDRRPEPLDRSQGKLTRCIRE